MPALLGKRNNTLSVASLGLFLKTASVLPPVSPLNYFPRRETGVTRVHVLPDKNMRYVSMKHMTRCRMNCRNGLEVMARIQTVQKLNARMVLQ